MKDLVIRTVAIVLTVMAVLTALVLALDVLSVVTHGQW